MTGFGTYTDALAAHGRLLSGQITEDVAKCVEAGNLDLTTDALGVMNQWCAAIFNDELARARGHLAAVTSAVESTGHQLTESATAYAETESANTGNVGG